MSCQITMTVYLNFIVQPQTFINRPTELLQSATGMPTHGLLYNSYYIGVHGLPQCRLV